MNLRKILTVSLCLVLVVSLCGISFGKDKKVTLRAMFWGSNDSYIKVLKQVVERFNNRNDVNATVEVNFIQPEQYKTKLPIEMAANNPPDVFMSWAAGFLKPYVEAGKVYPLTEALNKDAGWKKRFMGGIFDALTYNGKIYAVPNVQSDVVLYYNTEIFAKYKLKAPKTYNDLKGIVKTLVSNGVTPFALGNKQPWVGGLLSEVIANRIGGNEPFNKVASGAGKWTDPSFIEAGRYMAELAKLKAFPEGFNGLDYDPTISMFTEGKAAMLVMGSWAIGSVIADNSLIKGKVDIIKFPVITDGKGNVDTWLGQPDLNLAISEKCIDKKSALAFLKMFSDPETQKGFATSGNLIVTKTKLDPKTVDPLTLKVANLQRNMKGMFIFYDVSLGPVIGNEYNNTIQAILAGKDSEEAFKALQKFTEENKE